MDGLHRLRERHALIGDVRGAGLFIGVELVQDRATQAPATWEANEIVERMKCGEFCCPPTVRWTTS